MNKSLLIGVATGVVVAAAAGAGALATGKLALHPANAAVAPPAQTADAEPAPVPQAIYADVVSVTPVTQTVTTPSKQCHKEKVAVHAKPKDPSNVAGTAAGAVVGGVVLNQLGGGVFRALATTAGVIGGGYAGNRIENSVQKGSTKTVTRERCVTVRNKTTFPSGYQVAYTVNGKTEVVHMDHDPGKQLLLDKDGKVDLSAYSPDRSGQQGPSPGQPTGTPSPGGGGPAGSPESPVKQAVSPGGRPG